MQTFAILLLALVGVEQALAVKFVLLSPKTATRGEDYNVSLLLNRSPGDATDASTCNVTLYLLSCSSDTAVSSASQLVNFEEQTSILLSIPAEQGQENSSSKAKEESYKVHIESSDCDLTMPADKSQECAAATGPRFSIYIQTDKSMYKPTEMLQMRVFALHDYNLTTVASPFLIEVFDGNENKIQEWRDQQSESGLISLLLPIAQKPVLGEWRIRATIEGKSHESFVTVAEYVLPSFEVNISFPIPYYVRGSEFFDVDVSAMYSFGKSVAGSGVIEISSPIDLFFWHAPTPLSLSIPFDLTEERSTARLRFTREQIESLPSMGPQSMTMLKFVATLADDAGDTELNATKSAQVYDSAYKLEMVGDATPKAYRPGFPFVAFFKASRQDDSLLSEQEIEKGKFAVRVAFKCAQELAVSPIPHLNIFIPDVSKPTLTEIDSVTSTIDARGHAIANVTVPREMNCSSLSLAASLLSSSSEKMPEEGNYRVEKFGTIGDVTIKLDFDSHRESELFYVGDKVSLRATVSDRSVPTLYYSVLSRGRTVFESTLSTEGELTFEVELTQEMTPKCVVLLWAIAKNEVVGDSLEFNVEGALLNATISYDAEEKRRGELAELTVSSEPQSFVYLMAIDKRSVSKFGNENDITKDAVLRQLLCADRKCPDALDFLTRSLRGMRLFDFLLPQVMYDGQSTQEIFDKAGLLILTNYDVYSNAMYTPQPVDLKKQVEDVLSFVPKMPREEDHEVRQSFHEVWFWVDIDAKTNELGYSNVSQTVPEEMTTWVTTAFTLHPTRGFGIAESVELRVSSDFYITMQTPASITLGEIFDLTVVVYNDAVESDLVCVTIPKSDNLLASSGKDKPNNKEAKQCLNVARGVPESVVFHVGSSSLGAVNVTVEAQGKDSKLKDSLKREFMVMAEGIPDLETKAFVISFSEGSSDWNATVPITTHPEMVPSSLSIEVVVYGDLMSPSYNGIEELLQSPDLAHYLQAREQLSGELKQKAIMFMTTGYQQELAYRRDDYSFSAFGQSDPTGNLWLSAFLYRCFLEAKYFIYVDENIYNRTKAWIFEQYDRKTRMFVEPGRPMYTDMQGVSSSGVALNAFTLISLLENNASREEIMADAAYSEIISGAIQFLEEANVDSMTSYELAIVLYALTLHGESSVISTMESRLDSLKRTEGDLVYWPLDLAVHDKTSPIEIETASYVLLRLARKNDVTNGLPVMRWLISVRNQFGAYYGIHDTIVGLEALSVFTLLVPIPEPLDIKVDIEAGEKFSKSITISNDTQYTAQRVQIPIESHEEISDIRLKASGSGMGLVHVSWQYSAYESMENESRDRENETSSSVRIEAYSSLTNLGRTLKLRYCNSWLENTSSGMFMAITSFPTGFELDSTEEELCDQFGDEPFALKTVERMDDRTVALLFDELPRGKPVCVDMRAHKTMDVENRAPGKLVSLPSCSPQKQETMLFSPEDKSNSERMEASSHHRPSHIKVVFSEDEE